MRVWSDAPLYVRSRDLATWWFERTATWSSRCAPTLRDDTDRRAQELTTRIALALTFPARRERDRLMADECVVRLREGARLAASLGLLQPRQLRYVSGELDAIGRMIGGWQRRARGKARSMTPNRDGTPKAGTA